MLALFYSIYALENRNVEDTKLYKHQNEDITLFCGLSRKHEVNLNDFFLLKLRDTLIFLFF